MAKHPASGGSSSVENLTRVHRLVGKWLALSTEHQSSARWQSYWQTDVASTQIGMIMCDYIVPAEAATPAGAWRYMQRLQGSSKNTLSAGGPSFNNPSRIMLPNAEYTQFRTDVGTLTTDGSEASSGMGRSVLQLINNFGARYRSEAGLPIMCWWAGRGIGSSVAITTS